MSETGNSISQSPSGLQITGIVAAGTDQMKPTTTEKPKGGSGSPLMEQPSDGGPQSLAVPRWMEAFLGIIALVVWGCFFGAGILVSTASFRAVLWGPPAPLAEWLRAAVVTFFCYTVTNLFFLSCLSSYLGCMASRWHTSPQSNASSDFFAEVGAPRLYISAILRGFLLYLLVASGALIVSNEDAISSTTPAQYVRLAGLISSLGFIVGFDPQIIYRFLKKYTDLMNAPIKNAAKEPPGAPGEESPVD